MLGAIAAESRLLVDHHTGTRRSEDWETLWRNVANRLDPDAPLPLFASDGCEAIRDGLEAAFGVLVPMRYQGRGRPEHAVRVLPPDFMYVQVEKRREGRFVVEVNKHLIYGDPERIARILERTGTTINTSLIERGNLTTRTWNHRFVRKGLGYSKEGRCLEASLHLMKVYQNFLLNHPSLRKRGRGRPRKRGGPHVHRTPAMAAGITDHRWSWHDFLYWRRHA